MDSVINRTDHVLLFVVHGVIIIIIIIICSLRYELHATVESEL